MAQRKRSFGQDFKRFFFRGLAIVFPTLMTLALVAWAYNKIQDLVAGPINHGLQELIVSTTDFVEPSDADIDAIYNEDPAIQQIWNEEIKPQLSVEWVPNATPAPEFYPTARRKWMREDPSTLHAAELYALQNKWNSIAIGKWHVLDLIGLIIAVMVIYIIGVILGSYIGRRLYARGERLLDRVPLVRRIYPAFKQIAEFIVPDPEDDDETKMEFSRVVAVQYPRKGLWSVGMVTGNTMQNIQDRAGEQCLTIFVPSSPTPFTGYVITAPVSDTIDLPITVEEALKFAISGGVLVPPNQQIQHVNTVGPPRPLTNVDS